MITIKSENWLLAEAMERMLAVYPTFNGGLGRTRVDDLWQKVIAERGEDPRANATPISDEQLAFDVARLDDINEMFADRRTLS
jgi:hypothetical protein